MTAAVRSGATASWAAVSVAEHGALAYVVLAVRGVLLALWFMLCVLAGWWVFLSLFLTLVSLPLFFLFIFSFFSICGSRASLDSLICIPLFRSAGASARGFLSFFLWRELCRHKARECVFAVLCVLLAAFRLFVKRAHHSRALTRTCPCTNHDTQRFHGLCVRSTRRSRRGSPVCAQVRQRMGQPI